MANKLNPSRKFAAIAALQTADAATGTATYNGPCFSYSEALMLMKRGFRMARKGWNGKGMYVVYIPSQRLKEEEVSYNMLVATSAMYGQDYPVKAHLMMFTADQEFVPWLTSNTDQCADDWEIAGIPASFNIKTY